MSEQPLNQTQPSTPPSSQKPLNSPSPLSLRLIPEKWCAAWSQDNFSQYIPLYSPTATYTDHALRQIYKTHSSFRQHFIDRRTANTEFKVTLHSDSESGSPVYWSDSIVDDTARAMFRVICEGTNVRDMMGSKLSGKSFRVEGVVEIVIRKGDGLVLRVEEWYSRDFDEYAVEDGYEVLNSGDGVKREG